MKIRVCDLETCGLAPPAEVVEAAYCDLTLADGVWGVGLPVSWLCGVSAIPPETRAVHHIALAEVAGFPPFDVGQFGLDEPGIFVVAAHRSEFEAQWLTITQPFLCTWKAALRIWPDAPGHSNSVLRYWLEDRGLLSLDPALATPAHRAGPDAYVTAHVLKALLATGVTGKEMVGWTGEPAFLPRCPIGKFRNRPWPEVDQGFLEWMLRQEDMEPDLKWNAQCELTRRSGA